MPYDRFSYYVARSLAERLVLEYPPIPRSAQGFKLRDPPNPKVTLITDRVGIGLTRVDKVIHMQNNVTSDLWELAHRVARNQVDVHFRYVFVMVGLDWSLTVLKNMVKEGLKRFLYGVDKATGGCAVVGMIGITPHYADYEPMKVKTVIFNRCLKDVVRDCSRQWKVGYLPLHLHFLQEAGGFIQPLRRYFSEKSEFTLAGGFVLRQMLLKSIGVIPMDGSH